MLWTKIDSLRGHEEITPLPRGEMVTLFGHVITCSKGRQPSERSGFSIQRSMPPVCPKTLGKLFFLRDCQHALSHNEGLDWGSLEH